MQQLSRLQVASQSYFCQVSHIQFGDWLRSLVSELIVFCSFVALHWKTILFIVANAITGHSPCFGHRIFSCSNKTVPSSPSQENSNVALLTTETPDFIPPTLWPPNSLDLNPVGYCVWNVLPERVYYCTKVDNVVDLKQHIVAEWAALDHSIIASANAQWCLRLHVCIRAAGEDFEHCLQWHYPLFM